MLPMSYYPRPNLLAFQVRRSESALRYRAVHIEMTSRRVSGEMARASTAHLPFLALSCAHQTSTYEKRTPLSRL